MVGASRLDRAAEWERGLPVQLGQMTTTAAGEKDLGMTEADPDEIGPDGRVRLRCYLLMADTVWFSAGCQGRKSCGHSSPIGIRAAITLMGPEATVGE